MKKVCILLMAFFVCSFLFAGETKTYISIAYNYGNTVERAEKDGIKADTEIESNGFDLSVSGYFTEHWGLYLNTDYNFPSKATVTSGGISVTTTDSDWDFSMFLSGILGPVYKYSITPKFDIFAAAGFHIAQYTMTTKYASLINYSFGIGGDLGIRYLPTEHFYLTAGSLLSHDFSCKGEMKTAYETTKISDSYNLSSFRPYIGIGFTFSEIIK